MVAHCVHLPQTTPTLPLPPPQAGHLSLGALELFCSKQPYFPLFTDLSATNIVTTLEGPGLSVLFLATALCKDSLLRSTLSSLEFSPSLGEVISSFSGAPTNLDLGFPASDSQQEKRSYYRLWRSTACDLMQALCALQPSQTIQQSHTVSLLDLLIHFQ